VREDELPLFPLHAVLFPGGDLRLRIFEPRYLDLIRWCARETREFGVCLILEGGEAGDPALPVAFGTSARIADFWSLPDGLLGIAVTGGSRFHVRRTRVRDNGLIVATVDPVPCPRAEPVRAEHGVLVILLDLLLERVGCPHAKAPRAHFDEADWVGYRLAELLPLSPRERQGLLQCEDQHDRLERIVQRLPTLESALAEHG
jgi:uncharacterized protein